MPTYHYTVDSASGRKRLDRYLSEQGILPTRSQIKRLIASEGVTVNHSPTKASHRVSPGEEITVVVPAPQEPVAVPEALPLDILFEDEALVVVNKPAGMVVHPAAGNYSGTLVNALLYHCSFLSGVGGVLRPGIVHRLDKGTSGVMVIAKNDSVHLNLSHQFRARKVKKIYTALVQGVLKENEGSIETAIGRHEVDRKRMSVTSRRGRQARTCWKVKERFDMLTLLEITIHTGRTHQIRVHLASRHHPILGDRVYGSTRLLASLKNTGIRERLMAFSRPFLHASLLGFIHPVTQCYCEFRAPLPEELASLLTFLKEVQ